MIKSFILIILMGIMNLEHTLASPPKKIGFVLQNNEYFSTDWENFKVPQDMRLYLITMSNANSLNSTSSNFEEIFHIGEFDQNKVESIVLDVMNKHGLSADKALLITHDEYAIDIASRLRLKHNMSGPKPAQIRPFRDKAYAKSALKDSSVPIPTFISFSPERFQNEGETYLIEIESKLSYPMFAKPIDEARCADVSKIINRENLLEWAQNHPHSNYEIEEFVNGDLYTSICVIKDGKLVHHGAHQFLYPCFEFMNSKKPLGGYTLPNSHPDVKTLHALSKEVFKLFPIDDCVAHIEFMKDQTGRFVFIEAAARQPGGSISDIYYKKSDIHLGELNFRLQLGIPTETLEDNQFFAAWYWPHKPKGIVTSHNLPDIPSKYKYQWRTEIGQSYNGSEFLGDSSIRLILWNAEFPDLLEDMKYLENSYNATNR